MAAQEWISLIMLGLLLGALGQGVRSVMGAYKNLTRPQPEGQAPQPLSLRRLFLTIAGGACAGGLAALTLDSVSSGATNGKLTPEALGAMVAAGYAGTDFIEGFIRSRIPAT